MTILQTKIGAEHIVISVSTYPAKLQFPGEPTTYSSANYFKGAEYPDRELKTVDGATVGDVLTQAYQDLA